MTGTRTAQRLRQFLVGAQFAIATPLLIVAALLMVSLFELRRVDVGFDSRNIITGSVRLPAALYRDDGSLVAYWQALSDRLAAIAGVQDVAFTNSLPPENAAEINNFDLEDFPAGEGQSQPATPWVRVTPSYFRTLGIRLRAGRLLDDRDTGEETEPAIVVDQAWASRFFPNQSAVGKRLKSGGCTTCDWTTVVGVVSTVKYNGIAEPEQGTVYALLGPVTTRSFVIRSGAPLSAVVPAVRQAVSSLDPNVPLTQVASGEELLTQALETPRSLSLLVALFAAVALALSAIGIYGVMAFYVEQNRKDISIRLALGGRANDVLRFVLAKGLAVVLVGTVAGVLVAYGSTHWLASLLFEVGARDPRTFAAVVSVLLAVAALACFIPARRAVAAEPAVVLRSE